jgi:hypothetical protein
MQLPRWLRTLLRGRRMNPDPVEAELNQRQVQVAERLAKMQGKTRDEVLREAYRRADRIMAARHR